MVDVDGIMIGTESPAVSFGSELCWAYADGGVVVRDGESVVCEFATRYASRDGLRVIDAIRRSSDGYRVQVSDHGCGLKSVQVFNADGTLAADVNVAG
jgi:hypothetical protein